MAGLGYLYRRSSGIYVVRICVPLRMQSLVGKGELHITTKTCEPSAAKAVAFRIMAHWQGQILRGDMDVLTIAAGSPLLTGEGVMLVADAAAELGLSRSEILTELLNVRAELLCRADGWSGFAVATDKVEKDEGKFILNSAFEQGESKLCTSYLLFTQMSLVVQSLITAGEHSDCVFFFDRLRRKAFFLDVPGKTVTFDSLFVQKQAVELIRLRLAGGITPERLEQAKAEMAIAAC